LQKDEIIKNEQIKNSNLKELENEIELFRKHYNFSEEEKLI